MKVHREKTDRLLFICMVAAFVFSFLLAAFGCAPVHGTGVADTIPAVGDSVAKATAHTQTAENLVKAAKPESNATGQKLLTVASTEHQATLTALTDAKTQIATSESERASVEKKYGTVVDENTKIKNGWGYRLQVWVARVFWIIVSLAILHYVLLGASFIFPAAAPILTTIAAIINPAAWVQHIALLHQASHLGITG